MNNTELIKAGHELAKAINYDTPLIEIAKMVSSLATRLDCTTSALREAEKQRDALVAESAGLKAKAAALVHEASEVYSAYNSTITEPDGDFMDMQTLQEMQCVETPATDAYLAEVRAQGVESFAESQKEYVRMNRYELDSMTRAAYCGSAVDAERFAAQLRKGVQS